MALIFPLKLFKLVQQRLGLQAWPLRAPNFYRAGFSLLELMIVLGLVAALVALAVPRLSGQNNQMRQAVRKLSSIGRQLHSKAKLSGAVYRLVVDLNKGPESKGQKFWIEKATSKTVLTPHEMEESLQEREQAERDKNNSGQSSEKKQKLFEMDTQILKTPSELPGQLVFEDVELRRLEKPIIEGKAYIHFFPQGLADEAVLHLKASAKLRWSLAIRPLTGKTEVITEHVQLKDLRE